MGFKIGIKLLGFKDRHELAFEDNIKHSQFIYPDEMVRIVPHCFILDNYLDLGKKKKQKYSGSKRTFNALLKSLLKKNKIGLCLTLTRRNSAPAFCALLPQVLVFFLVLPLDSFVPKILSG
jgi:ATP-dependent DNA helicase 2 subunit 1